MTKAKAADALVSAGLTVTAAHAWSADVKTDVVIAQAPKAGGKVEAGGTLGSSPLGAATADRLLVTLAVGLDGGVSVGRAVGLSDGPPPVAGPEPPVEPPS